MRLLGVVLRYCISLLLKNIEGPLSTSSFLQTVSDDDRNFSTGVIEQYDAMESLVGYETSSGMLCKLACSYDDLSTI